MAVGKDGDVVAFYRLMNHVLALVLEDCSSVHLIIVDSVKCEELVVLALHGQLELALVDDSPESVSLVGVVIVRMWHQRPLASFRRLGLRWLETN